jgi:murein DD-endopeptidase MepM/ murein hydrolase activator NlpD
MTNKQKLSASIVSFLAAIILLVLVFTQQNNSNEPVPGIKQIQQEESDADKLIETTVDTTPAETPASEGKFKAPMPDYLARVTKKAFGTFVTPANSPVIPEKFSGYHAAIDLEIFPGEEESDVQVNAICDGKLAIKRTASGYGGIVAQYCVLNGQDILVLYGHVALNSVAQKVGDEIKVGNKLGILGQPGIETDGERKHLHLGIRKGHELVIAGYVQSESALSAFIDPKTVLEQ